MPIFQNLRILIFIKAVFIRLIRGCLIKQSQISNVALNGNDSDKES